MTNNNSTACVGNCTLSNCWACYHSYTALTLPSTALSCSAGCPIENGIPQESCIKKWGHCVLVAYTSIYREVSVLIYMYML